MASARFLALCFALYFQGQLPVIYGLSRSANGIQQSVADAIIQRMLTGHALRLDSNTHVAIGQNNECESCAPTPRLDYRGPATVDVPCNFSYTKIFRAQLTVNPPVSTPWYMVQNVMSESPSDGNKNYIWTYSNGSIHRGATILSRDVTQTIGFALQNAQTNATSNLVTITFVFHSCVLEISGPASVNYDGCYWGEFPQMAYQVINAPADLSVTWDIPGNLGAVLPTLEAASAYAPGILSSNLEYNTGGPASEQDLCVINCNYNHLESVPPAPDHTGHYCACPWQGNVCVGCQTLLLSVTPYGHNTPYLTGSLAVQACGTLGDCSGPIARSKIRRPRLKASPWQEGQSLHR